MCSIGHTAICRRYTRPDTARAVRLPGVFLHLTAAARIKVEPNFFLLRRLEPLARRADALRSTYSALISAVDSSRSFKSPRRPRGGFSFCWLLVDHHYGAFNFSQRDMVTRSRSCNAVTYSDPSSASSSPLASSAPVESLAIGPR